MKHNDTFWELFYEVYRVLRIPALGLSILAAVNLINAIVGLQAHGIALLMMNIYIEAIDSMLAPLEPAITGFIHLVEKSWKIQIELSPQWKQIFILTNFYTFGVVFGYVKRRMMTSLLVHLFAALCFSLLGSLFAGAFLMPANVFWDNFLLACTPLVSIHLFYVMTHLFRASFERKEWGLLNGEPNIGWMKFFKLQQRHANQILIGGMLVALGMLSVPIIASFPSAGILVFFAHMQFMILFGFTKGYFDAAKRHRNDPNKSLGNYYLNSGNVMAAISYLAITIGVTCSILAGVFFDLLQKIK